MSTHDDERKRTLPKLNDNPDDPIGRYGIPGYFSLAQLHRNQLKKKAEDEQQKDD